MVGTLPPSLQSQPPAASSSLAPAGAAGAGGVVATTTVAATSSGGGGVALAEEEALKRNTDCVYFLASPLTCKKGSECEYRHSDIARVNPRDCWYWLHGNCLNPKCGFRHPPLDGLLGTQMPNPVVTSVPASQPATTPAASVSYASGKQGVPCVFFQKGICLKGDWCPFLHAPNSANNKQSQEAIPASEPPVFKKTFGSLEKGTQDKKITQTSGLKSAELTTQAKPILKVESAPAKKETNNSKRLPPSGVDNELRGYRPVDTANNGNRVSWTTHVQQQQPLQVNDHTTTLNSKDLEEPSREPSPGFDVLVDNELGDSDYYHTEDHFGRSRDHEEMNEYYDGRSGDYGSLLDADRDIYRDSRGYDSYEQLQGQYGWEQRRSSSERMSGVLAYPEQRRYSMADSPDQIDESDLRHHLSKHRRVNGLRSVINHDYPHERPDEQGHQGSRRDLRQDRDRRDSSLSSRLRGRIKIPGASSSPTDVSDLRSDKETERRRERSGLSPGGSQVPSRLRDRIKGKVQEDFNNDGRNNRGLRMRTDMISDNNIDFAAPKSLAELKSSKSADGSDQQSMGKRKYSKIDYQQQAGEDLSFEGPKPLEEILKRKRKSDSVVSGSGMTSQYAEDNSQRKADESSKQVVHFSPSKNDSSLPHKENEEYKLASGVKSVSEGAQSGDSQSLSHGKNGGEVEEGLIVDDATKVREPEAYDHGDEDFDYEQGDGDNYNVDEGENGDAEEEYLDDEDGGDDGDDDDFAKKMGVMY
ncbi:zinc finger CCCH domain-containing protein 17-like [Coffea arabica]|uniref:Zinc finger CCCH domain-containing protein 17-like n=1 Tax=Coffea arabica TaxID=13443 RepID=A0ABM4W960_COFAR